MNQNLCQIIMFISLIQIASTETKSKITKILHSEENSKRKVPNQMAKPKDKTHQTNGQQQELSDRHFKLML